MSAVSNLTYVLIVDADGGVLPQYGSGFLTFANYNEAMSYCRWQSLDLGTPTLLYVWNYNGQSGNWRNGVFLGIPNINWP